MNAEYMINPEQANSIGGPLVIASYLQHDAARITENHQHLRGQLLGAEQGLLAVETRGGKWVVPATHAVWIPPGLPHALQSFGSFAGWSVYIAPEGCNAIASEPGVIAAGGLLYETVLRAISWQQSTLNKAQQRIAEVMIDEMGSQPRVALELPLPKDPRLLKIARALIASPGQQQGLKAWADWAAISPRTLTRRFVQETGFTFTEWRQRIRLLTALEMLTTGNSVTTVALALGYENISTFIALFKRTFGVTPGRYQV